MTTHDDTGYRSSAKAGSRRCSLMRLTNLTGSTVPEGTQGFARVRVIE